MFEQVVGVTVSVVGGSEGFTGELLWVPGSTRFKEDRFPSLVSLNLYKRVLRRRRVSK